MDPAIYGAIFIILGIALIGVEIKLIPGFGVIGIAGLASAIYGSWLAFETSGIAIGVGVTAGATLSSLALMIILIRSRWARRLVLETTTRGQPSALPDETPRLVGRTGTTITALRPGGLARLDGRRTDVVAENGAYIDPGTPIEVVRVAQNSIVVRARRALPGEEGES